MHATDIIAYTYGADVHCVDCTRNRVADGTGLSRDPHHPYAATGKDDHGIPLDAVDTEGNIVHPVFGSDETPPRGEYCGDCGREIVEPYCPDGYEIFEASEYELSEPGWYWWSCQPGCLPDGGPIGPFATEDEALRDLTSDLDW